MGSLKVGASVFWGLLSIWTTVLIALSFVMYDGASSSLVGGSLSVTGAVVAAIGGTLATIILYSLTRWLIARRRRPFVWIAIGVLDKASSGAGPPIHARGISDRNGNLAISLEISGNDPFAVGDQINATNTVTRQPLGTLEVVVIEQDYCLCEVTDRMDSSDFWTGLEERMMRSFCPPYMVEFSRYVDETWIDSVSRLVRRWGE